MALTIARLLPAAALLAALLTPGQALAGDEQRCNQTTIQQVVDALHRRDVATLSRPQMIHGTCISNGHLRNGERIGVQIMFGAYYGGALAGIGTSVYTPLPNADPMTNPRPPEFAVGQAR
jgi:hypothetical protein